MDDFTPISDHGLIGDLQTAALVATDGTIDWFCAPRFDSPSMFASLLDRRNGGYFRIAPVGENWRSVQMYFPGSACLITRFLTDEGIAEVIDFMPIRNPHVASGQRQIGRGARVIRGEVTFLLECRPRFDYGRQPHKVDISSEGALFHANGTRVALHGAGGATATPEEDVRLEFTLGAGQARRFLLETEPEGNPRPVSQAEGMQALEETVGFWRRWLNQCTYTGRWRETIHRSAMTLKLMTYAPTGALVAAPTAALPEQIGGSRNWDYRFTWVRDGSFSVFALFALGYHEEARSFLSWLGERVAEQAGDGSGPLKIMYRVDGSSDLVEEELDHFEGYRGSRPVRIGNGAADQLQLDKIGRAHV